jgi:hypothetical protein
MTGSLQDRVIAAHGGAARWRDAEQFDAIVSARGLAFTMKNRPPFVQARLSGAVHHPLCRLTPIGGDPELCGVLDGADTRIETRDGRVQAHRSDARAALTRGGKLWRWDDLDMAYFANYAFWGYLTLPALLLRKDVLWSQTSPTRLRATFPPDLPVHSPIQTFDFDAETGLLLRNSYTAEVIGGWAKASQRISAHRSFGGVPVPTRRIVTPRGPFCTTLPGPVLIDIRVHDFTLA